MAIHNPDGQAMAKGVAALLAKYGPLSGVQQHSILDRLAENGHDLEPDLVNNLLHKLLVEDGEEWW